MRNKFIIKNENELQEVVGEANASVKDKVAVVLDDSMIEFIKQSPLLFLSTIDNSGQPDVSPKGDAPGFVHIDSNNNLLIPDRLGNKLVFGFKNILNNNNVGLIFIVPNTRETLRLKGRATLSRDPLLLSRLSANEKPAILCTQIEVNECYFHCGKAMIRSKTWNPESWADNKRSLMVQQMAKKIANTMDSSEKIESTVESDVERSYREELY